MASSLPKNEHKPNERHTLDEVLKSLQDLIRNELDHPGSAPARPAKAKLSAPPVIPKTVKLGSRWEARNLSRKTERPNVDVDAVLSSLRDLITSDLGAQTERAPPAATAKPAPATRKPAPRAAADDVDIDWAEIDRAIALVGEQEKTQTSIPAPATRKPKKTEAQARAAAATKTAPEGEQQNFLFDDRAGGADELPPLGQTVDDGLVLEALPDQFELDDLTHERGQAPKPKIAAQNALELPGEIILEELGEAPADSGGPLGDDQSLAKTAQDLAADLHAFELPEQASVASDASNEASAGDGAVEEIELAAPPNEDLALPAAVQTAAPAPESNAPKAATGAADDGIPTVDFVPSGVSLAKKKADSNESTAATSEKANFKPPDAPASASKTGTQKPELTLASAPTADTKAKPDAPRAAEPAVAAASKPKEKKTELMVAPEPPVEIKREASKPAAPKAAADRTATKNELTLEWEPPVAKTEIIEAPPPTADDDIPVLEEAGDRAPEAPEKTKAATASQTPKPKPKGEAKAKTGKSAATPAAATAAGAPSALEIRQIAIKAIAKLNIELRRSGERTLDPRMIDRLQFVLRELLKEGSPPPSGGAKPPKA